MNSCQGSIRTEALEFDSSKTEVSGVLSSGANLHGCTLNRALWGSVYYQSASVLLSLVDLSVFYTRSVMVNLLDIECSNCNARPTFITKCQLPPRALLSDAQLLG